MQGDGLVPSRSCGLHDSGTGRPQGSPTIRAESAASGFVPWRPSLGITRVRCGIPPHSRDPPAPCTAASDPPGAGWHGSGGADRRCPSAFRSRRGHARRISCPRCRRRVPSRSRRMRCSDAHRAGRRSTATEPNCSPCGGPGPPSPNWRAGCASNDTSSWPPPRSGAGSTTPAASTLTGSATLMLSLHSTPARPTDGRIRCRRGACDFTSQLRSTKLVSHRATVRRSRSPRPVDVPGRSPRGSGRSRRCRTR